MRGICEGVEHQLWTGDSHPACRGICTLRSSKPIPQCTAVRAAGGVVLREESEVQACWAGYFEWLYHAGPPAVEMNVRVLLSLLLILQLTVIHLCLWKHRLQ